MPFVEMHDENYIFYAISFLKNSFVLGEKNPIHKNVHSGCPWMMEL